MNLHAAQLETLLLRRGVTIEKVRTPSVWRISKDGAKTVTYAPLTGRCLLPETPLRRSKWEELKGSPERVAEILCALM